jgi:hypothetical protein
MLMQAILFLLVMLKLSIRLEILRVRTLTVNTYKTCGFQALGKGGDVSSGGTLGANTGGFTSVSRSATGQYLVTLNAT